MVGASAYPRIRYGGSAYPRIIFSKDLSPRNILSISLNSKKKTLACTTIRKWYSKNLKECCPMYAWLYLGNRNPFRVEWVWNPNFEVERQDFANTIASEKRHVCLVSGSRFGHWWYNKSFDLPTTFLGDGLKYFLFSPRTLATTNQFLMLGMKLLNHEPSPCEAHEWPISCPKFSGPKFQFQNPNFRSDRIEEENKHVLSHNFGWEKTKNTNFERMEKYTPED